MTWQAQESEHEEERASFQPLGRQMEEAFRQVRRVVARATREHEELAERFEKLRTHAAELERENARLRIATVPDEWRQRALAAEERLAKILSVMR